MKNYVSGSLAAYILNKRNTLTIDMNCSILLGLSQAISELQQQSLVHLNIRPSNILLEKLHGNRWSCVLTDFDTATEYSTIDKIQMSKFKHISSYMAPELIKYLIDQTPITVPTAADIYSLAMIFVVICKRQDPWKD